MSEDRSWQFLDYLIFIAKRKTFLLVLAGSVMVLSYTLIYFFIDEEFEAVATVIPSESKSLAGMGSLFKSLSSLPFGLGASSSQTEMDLYTAFVFSRTTMEKVVRKFDLLREYDVDTSMEKGVKTLREKVSINDEDKVSYSIAVRAKTPQKAAEMTNYIVELLNESIIDLNVKKSKDNRLFLEGRYLEIKEGLKYAEDSLLLFQKNTGVFEAEQQVKASIEAFANLDAELARKQTELEVVRKISGKESVAAMDLEAGVSALEEKIRSIKKGKTSESVLLAFGGIPDKAMEYFRLFRNVKIMTAMLEFVLPLYEQARFEEQKDTPIFQVLDHATPPEKRVYPKRVIMSAGITFFVLFTVVFLMMISEVLRRSSNPKVAELREELRLFTRRGVKSRSDS